MEFCTSGHLPDFLTSTQKLKEWNRPRQRRVEAIPVLDLNACKHQITKKDTGSTYHPIPSQYDPRPLSLRSPINSTTVENLRTDLLECNPSCALLQVIVPSVDKVKHDHCYIGNSTNVHSSKSDAISTSDDEIVPLLDQVPIDPIIEKRKLNVTMEERRKIEERTRCQSHSFEWFVVRSRRITASKCGKIICQKERTDALLVDVLYRKTMNPRHLPLPIKWGIERESFARDAYVSFMRCNGHDDLRTRSSGFVIHPTMGWLGASPDAFVTDPSTILPDGIAEFKCPFSKRNISPLDACSDPQFYCTMENNKLRLKRHHPYYHQVQLQLYVCQDMCCWCDFCVYTLKGVAVERIFLDAEWCNTYIVELESYFDGYMLPEIVFPKLKPSYVL